MHRPAPPARRGSRSRPAAARERFAGRRRPGKQAGRRAWKTQKTKAYLGSQGDTRLTELIRPIVFGEALARDERIVGLQTPGGCGALRVGADLIERANPKARIFVGQPTWP